MSAAIFDKRENMGASPLAIEYAECIADDLAEIAGVTVPRGQGRMLIAALVDAAIRKSGAPEMLRIVKTLDDWSGVGAEVIYFSTLMPSEDAESNEDLQDAVRVALAKAEGRAL